MGNITIQGDLTGDVPGGEVGGASNLTTVGAIPYVSAAGTLNQDPTALFWDAANDRATFGVAKIGTGFAGAAEFSVATSFGTANFALLQTGTQTILNGSRIDFRIGNTDAMLVAPTTRNLLIGTTTDSNFKLDVAASGSAGTARFYGGAGVSDTTKVVVRAGAGQSGNLQEWTASNGTTVNHYINNDEFYFKSFQMLLQASYVGAIKLNSASTMGWTNGIPATNALDLSLSRASAGVLQVGDGGSNALGQVNARAVNSVNTLVAYNSTGGIFMAGNAGSSWGTMQSYSDGAGTAKATAINPNGGNVLVGTTTDDGANKLQVSTPAGAIVANTAFLSPSMANGNKVYLTIGTSSSSNNSFTWLYNHSSTSSSRYLSVQPYEGQIGSSSTWFASSNMTVGDVTAAPLDPGFRFSVRSSGSSGTFRIFDEVPTTGVTKAVIRAGAGQSTTNLTEWQNASTGAVLSYFSADASLVLNSSGSGLTAPQVISSGNIRTGGNAKATSSGFFGWVSGADTSAALDTALYRNAAGVLEINNGTAGTYRDILARRHQASGETVASLPAAAAGNAGTISYVTDANATTIGSTVAGGGANKVLVWSNGTAWKIFAN